MPRRKITAGLVALAEAVILSAPVTYGQAPPLRVEIKLPRDTVANKEGITISTNIYNVSDRSQSFHVWSCSFPSQWIANNTAVHIPTVPCKKNDVVLVELKSKRFYERKLELYIDVGAREKTIGPISFQLGFKPVGGLGTELPGSPFWSNTVRINISN